MNTPSLNSVVFLFFLHSMQGLWCSYDPLPTFLSNKTVWEKNAFWVHIMHFSKRIVLHRVINIINSECLYKEAARCGFQLARWVFTQLKNSLWRHNSVIMLHGWNGRGAWGNYSRKDSCHFLEVTRNCSIILESDLISGGISVLSSSGRE